MNISIKSREILKDSGDDAARSYLTKYSQENAEQVVKDWWNLSDALIVGYSNGMMWDPVQKTDSLSGYPDWWYNASGYQYGPRVYDVNRLRQVSGLYYQNQTIHASSDRLL